jgi:glycosyltransferase involved in cell wall biosynthesis
MRRPRLAIVATHPIQYYVPWYRALAEQADLDVYYCHRQTASGQADAGFNVAFEWDLPLLEGYRHTFLRNVAAEPSVERFQGCDTPEIRTLIEQKEFDAVIVHGWSTKSYWQAMRACWRTGTPVLVRGDSTLGVPKPGWWRAAKWPVFRAFIPRFDGYLIVGSKAREYLLHYGADPARCFPAPHAVDNRFFFAQAEALQTDRASVRREFGLPEDAFVALFVGRFVGIKRPDVFVQAVAQAASQSSQVRGLMVGDGPRRSELSAWVDAHQAPITFSGFLNQTQIPRAYAAADVLVLSSTSETWGLVANEAMASGCPAAVSDGVGCAGDLVRHGETGIVTPVGGVDALASELVRLASDRSALERLRKAARQEVARFSVDAAVSGTLEAVAAVRRAA